MRNHAPSSGWPLSLSTLRMMMAERGVFSNVRTLLSPPEMKHSCVAGSLMAYPDAGSNSVTLYQPSLISGRMIFPLASEK